MSEFVAAPGIEIFCVNIPTIQKNWELYKPLIDAAVVYDIEKKLMVDGIYDHLMTGLYQLVAGYKDKELLVVAITKPMRIELGNSLMIVTIGGDQSELWVNQIDEYFAYLAKGLGCTDGIIFCSREGWQKKLKKRGYKVLLQTMWRPL